MVKKKPSNDNIFLIDKCSDDLDWVGIAVWKIELQQTCRF